MKIIIFGLGNFGQSLALSLTESGNEVIGIDIRMDRVNLLKDKITYAIQLDSTNELAYSAIPLKDTDVAIVAIGEDEGAAIITSAILKKLTTTKIIARSLSPIHDNVLEAMGIEDVVHPEKEAADRLTKKINLKNAINSFEIGGDYTISEIQSKPSFDGKTLGELNFRDAYNLNIIGVLSWVTEKDLLGREVTKRKVQNMPNRNTRLKADDILIVFGSNDDMAKFCEKN
ncbi:MAG: TrkA family potassium uptake protein [Flavobacteriales bacterium]